MSLKLGIVINSRARHTGDLALPTTLLEMCRAAKVAATTAVTHSIEELRREVHRLYEQKIDVWAVCGGDGTLLATLGALFEVYSSSLPPLLILPGGTMNTVARNLGLRGRPEAVLASFLYAFNETRGLAAVPRFAQPLLRLRTLNERPLKDGLPQLAEPAISRTRYGCIFGAAMGARFLAAYSRHPGLPWALLLAMRTIGSSLIPGGGAFARWMFERTSTELSIDGEKIAEPAFRLLLCSTVPDVGLGMGVPWRGGYVPDRFHLIASSLPITSYALQFLRMQRGQPLRGSPHVDRLAQSASFHFAEPQPLTLDGDLFSAGAVELSLAPSVDILLPPSPALLIAAG